MRRVFSAVLCFSMGLLGIPVAASASGPARTAKQTPQNQGTGGVQGVAKNAQQQNLPSVRIQVRGRDGQLVAIGTTNHAGEFSFAGLNPGIYTVEILNTAGEIVGTASVTVTAGATAMLTLSATAAGTIAAAGSGGASLFGLGTLGTVAVIGAAGAATVVGIVVSRSTASPSR